MKKQVPIAYYTAALKACRNLVNVGGSSFNPQQLTRMAPTTPTTTLVGPAHLKPPTPKIPFSYGDPCLDLFFHVVPDPGSEYRYASPKIHDSHKYINQLLPLAWSHNPLTTLKLIFNLLGVRSAGKDDREGFYKAAYWLHQNHPKTLAYNVPFIADSFGNYTDILELLYRVLEGHDVRTRRKQNSDHLYLEIEKEGNDPQGPTTAGRIIAMANKAVERYERDPDYQFLHNRVADLYAECFKFDVQNLKKHMYNVDECECFEITHAANWCPLIDSSYDRATLLCESIAKKVFPRELYQGLAEADYACRVRDQLRKQILVPLNKVLDRYHKNPDLDANQWGFRCEYKKEPKIKDVKAGRKSKMEAAISTEPYQNLAVVD